MIKYILLITLCTHSYFSFAERSVLNKHNEERIYVFGHRQNSQLVDLVPSVTELSGEELLMRRETSLGDNN